MSREDGLRRRMSDTHEEHMVEVYGGRMTPGSGNQWNRPTDGRTSHYDDEMAFARDGKSTRARSISIKREDLDKLVVQCQPERPMLPIRFYDDDRLRGFEDWVLFREEDTLEFMQRARLLSAYEKAVEAMLTEAKPGSSTFTVLSDLLAKVQEA